MTGSGGEAFKAFEAEGWSAQASTYGELSGAITRRIAEPLLDAALVRHGERVLDVATGPGYVAELAAARGASVVGLDIAEGMLAEARRRLPALEFVVGDAERLPFGEGEFDAVVGSFVVNHLPDPERALAEAVRVVRPGGGVACSVINAQEGIPVMGLVTRAIEAAGIDEEATPAPLPPGPDPFRFADPAEFRRLLEGAGLDEVRVELVELGHRIAGAEQLWQGFLGGSVRGASWVRAQPAEARAAIRAALDDVVRPHRTGDELELRVEARIASGRRG